LSELERSIQYAKLGGYQRLEAYAITSLGDLFRDLKSTREAEEAYGNAEEIDRQIDDQFLHFYLRYIEADLALSRKALKKAEEMLEAAHTAAEKAGSPYEIHLCQLLSGKIAFENKHFKAALEQFSRRLSFSTRRCTTSRQPLRLLWRRISRGRAVELTHSR